MDQDHDEVVQQREADSMRTQETLMGMSDQPQQFRQNQFQALLDKCHRAQRGDDEGLSYLTMPF